MESTFWLILLKLLAVVVLILANGFFVAAEFSLVSVRRTRISELVSQGNPAARWVQKAIHDPDRFIAATQLGITISSLGLGWIGEPAVAELIEPLLDSFPALAEKDIVFSLSVAISFALITFLHVVVGELMPKTIALLNPEKTSLVVAQPTVVVEWIFKPAIWLLNGTGNLLLKLIGVQTSSSHEMAHSVEELKMLVTASKESGVVEDEQGDILNNVFNFNELLVRQVMAPRTEMAAVPADATLDDMINIAIEQPYTKLPVFQESFDQIIGIVHLKEILRAQHTRQEKDLSARDLMREALFIPETARIATLLTSFRTRKQHMAIVLDEYGGTAGVVTLEDLLEEIIGEVQDPFNNIPQIESMPDGSFLIDGLTLIEDVNDHFNLQLTNPYYDTIAGYLLGKLKRLARVGDTIEENGYLIRVVAMDGKRIDRIAILPIAS
ncbi:MAG: HlyC/CorC family transporter [Anaerolineales bacterium]|nr:HlyC/CorC family transporter [Anaerolineales bacterium]